ncbi:DUF3431 domain-containing protein [Fibrisoma montanum]|uniref:DUF3431 domain-containing protein n=1 Tax=Fibrisoma montanum TaxID=2305895 RepID=A0A418MBH8_9BACT|nr:DUF3431 domain-containing protein [Fibrisoma montanum]RIV23700.1 DUF3431 domain-containing protein [Fibrisoma montanum]
MNASAARFPIELVVARYHEPLNWLRKVPKTVQITVYDKHERDPYPGAVPLPNVGREAHTYLHHLVTRYDSLAEWTVFCQGKPFDHAYDFHHQLRAFAANPADIGSFRWLGHIIDTDDDQGERLFRQWSKNDDQRGLDIRGFHRALFGSEGPGLYSFVLGAQFAVHRDVIRQRSVAFYERALELTVTFPDAAHCFERTWDRVLGVVGIDPVWLNGRLTVYLKPVRKVEQETSNH